MYLLYLQFSVRPYYFWTVLLSVCGARVAFRANSYTNRLKTRTIFPKIKYQPLPCQEELFRGVFRTLSSKKSDFVLGYKYLFTKNRFIRDDVRSFFRRRYETCLLLTYHKGVLGSCQTSVMELFLRK